MSQPLQCKVVAKNKKALHDYIIEEKMEAGIMLQGSEVKSLRLGKVSITESHAAEMHDAIYLFNANIAKYSGANRFNHNPTRPRKLLLHRRQINKLLGRIKIKGYTLVALSIYFDKNNRAKVELALAKGKKLHDKRESLKEKDWEREKGRLLRGKDLHDN